MAYTTTSESIKSGRKRKFILTDSVPLTDSLYSKFKEFFPEKSYKKETLSVHGCLQGQCSYNNYKDTSHTPVKSSKSVLAFPMGEGDYSWHCINYTEYPEEPRFLTASTDQKRSAELGLLGLKPFNRSAKMVFLTEGIWDMLTMYENGYHVLGLPGVNNLQPEWCDVFADKSVYLLFDNDKPGRDFTIKHSKLLVQHAASVYIIRLPEKVAHKGREHSIKDITDLFNIDGKFAEATLKELVASAELVIVDPEQLIAEIVASRGNNIQKSIAITELILRDIEGNGGRIIPYNNNQEFALVLEGVRILTDEEIDVHLSREYGYFPSDSMWRFVRDKLYVAALKNKEAQVKLYSHSHNGSCFIGTKTSGIIQIDSTGASFHPQGTDDVYVQSSNNLIAITPINPKKSTTFESLLDLFLYDGNTDTQKFLLKSWFYHTFFNSVMRVILCVTGDPGSGKTLLLKILKGILFGFTNGKSNPNSMPEEDYVFTMMMKTYRYLFLDEINENDPRIKTKFRMLATGEESIFRPKYAKQAIRFRPSVWLAVSAHSPKFRESDIAQRLCLVRLLHPAEKTKLINETLFLADLEQKREEIWNGIARTLQMILANFKKGSEQIPLKNYCRQVELATFAWNAFPEERKLCLQTFENINQLQEEFAAEFDPIMDLLESWMEHYSKNYVEAGRIVVSGKSLYTDMAMLSKERGLKSFPASVQGFGKWLNGRASVFGIRYGYKRVKDHTLNMFMYSFDLPIVNSERPKEKERF
jgi:energy-coupling factor transporter ATP-binding protein EcfA2